MNSALAENNLLAIWFGILSTKLQYEMPANCMFHIHHADDFEISNVRSTYWDEN